jgi:O-antigen ligase
MKGLQALLEHYFPCPFERGGPVLVVVGVFSALLFVYIEIWYEGKLYNLPQNLMLLTFLISAWGQRRQLKSDLVFKLVILAGVIPWLLFAINALIDYDTAAKYLSASDLLKLCLFLPLAWWTGGSWLGARRMLAIAFLGLLTAVALDPNLMQSLNSLWSGGRIDFDIHNAQHGALFFGLAILFPLCSFIFRNQDEPVSGWANTLLLIAGLIGLAGLVGTQTRAAYVGLMACGLVALIQVIRQRKHSAQKRISMAKGLLVLALVAGLLTWSAKDILYERVAAESSTFKVLLSGNLEKLPFDSIGIRVHSWVEALKWIAERPITGWGRKARSDVIRLADHFPAEVRTSFGHLHNGYLEILVGFGAVGFFYLCILWIVLLRRIKLAADKDLYAFALYSSVFFLVLNLLESFFVKSSGEFAVTLFMAAGYSQYLAKTLDDRPPN